MESVRPRKDQVRNRALLIDAARKVYGNQGVDAPFDLVAKAAGLSNATLYRHFPQREHLLVEVYRLSLTENLSRFAALDASGDPWASVVEYCRWVFDTQFENLTLTRCLATIPAGLDSGLDAQRAAMRDSLMNLIDRAKGEGRFRSDRYLDDLILYFAANEVLAGLGEDARPQSRRLFELMIDSISTERHIDPNSVAPAPLTMDSVLTKALSAT
ncbi:TetR/AcrR family transcriptional regulator [Rhodococcoides yunnanense]|uniref:TetR/AcrR family transcriptional regulator n=1 Tax=Rhodococcoides yunnanense TaxID=278209 RepID=UPI0009334363|nr:TetR/AcrR family transcriptional regulator [Rhodococcus yunnanensis]